MMTNETRSSYDSNGRKWFYGRREQIVPLIKQCLSDKSFDFNKHAFRICPNIIEYDGPLALQISYHTRDSLKSLVTSMQQIGDDVPLIIMVKENRIGRMIKRWIGR